MNAANEFKLKINLVATLLIVLASGCLMHCILGEESTVSQRLCLDSIELQSPKCNGNGKYACGVCECDDAHFGANCECVTSDSDCRQSDTTIECSGRGRCECGECKCDLRNRPDELIYGKYCECDNYSCERFDGQICAGNGVCECGYCKCKAGWTNDVCSMRI